MDFTNPSPLQSPSTLIFTILELSAGMDTFFPDHSFLSLTLGIWFTVRIFSGFHHEGITCTYFFPALSTLFPFFLNGTGEPVTLHNQVNLSWPTLLVTNFPSWSEQEMDTSWCTNPTNKTQVFNEISFMETWLIIHVINSRTLLVLYSWKIYFSQSWRFLLCTAQVKNAKIFFENSCCYFTCCTRSKINQCKILHIPIVLSSSNAMPEFLEFNSCNYHVYYIWDNSIVQFS